MCCGNRCGLGMATQIGSHFGCLKIIYGAVKLKFDIWTPSNQVSIINCMRGGGGGGVSSGCDFVMTTFPGNCFGSQSLFMDQSGQHSSYGL